MSQATGRADALRDGISRTALGRRQLESRRLGQASARDSNIPRAGPGAVGPARPGSVLLARVGSTRKKRWVINIGKFYNYLKTSQNVTFFGVFRFRTEMPRVVIFWHAKKSRIMSRVVILWRACQKVTNRHFFSVR